MLREQRDALIIEAKADGHTWPEIATACGLSRAMTIRAAQKHEQAKNRK
ncbi:hypothetical protein INS90_10160 [Trueperella pecoris]|uniref:Uncharacterized protein n=1 Tax=Trueperella pecoris TaxID=2733571 RepID=A0A7M1R0D8_9ACTO|nr:hypothetical protein [Trueperella pecoris]QOR47593.1 hypothetical protein INS90_10160 [Trueperella pecoris]